jgi:Flp pilus assembly protein TadG
MFKKRRLGNQRGTSTLELIVVLPTLLFVLFGIVELSRAWLMLNLTTTAAREAARAGSVAAANSFPDPPSATQRIDDILGAGNWSGGVTCSPMPCATDARVEARVTINFQTLVPLLQPALGSSMAITQTARARYE